MNAVLLRPLPFAEPDRIVSFWGSVPQMGIPVLNYWTVRGSRYDLVMP